MSNSIHVIHPYRHPQNPKTWVFDDERHGLVQEPFVLGASEAIDRIVSKKFGDTDRVEMIFSITPIPNADCVLKRVMAGYSPDKLGCTYHDGTEELWLCPAMTHYFGTERAPEEIYITAQKV